MIATTLYYHETKKGIEQAVIIDGRKIQLGTLVPGAVYKRTGQPPRWYPHPTLGWLYFEEFRRI